VFDPGGSPSPSFVFHSCQHAPRAGNVLEAVGQSTSSVDFASQADRSLQDGSTFPNTIILSANFDEDGNYIEDPSIRWHASSSIDGCICLTIPTERRLASIIDGQHRLEGFGFTDKADRQLMELPCAVFVNLPRPYQARIFATININQKRVDKSLAYELFGYDLNESDANKWPPDMLGVYFARVLEGRADSPFKGHIRLALLEEDEAAAPIPDGHKWSVSVACIVEGITKLISEKPIADRSALASGIAETRRELPADKAPLRELYRNQRDKPLLDAISEFFSVVDRLIWVKQPASSYAWRTVGVQAFFDILREGLSQGKLDPNQMETSAEQFLRGAAGIIFVDDFFQASGAGRVRIRRVLQVLVGLEEAFDEGVEDAVRRLKGQVI
jgi:DNA phosphorothioation-associated DGQHR protein 1